MKRRWGVIGIAFVLTALAVVAFGGVLNAQDAPQAVVVAPPSLTDPLVAYIYDTDATAAADYQTFLNDEGFRYQGVSFSEVGATDFSDVDLIVIGGDIRRVSPGVAVWDDTDITHLEASNKPVMGVGEAGAEYFSHLGLEIGNLGSLVIDSSLGPVITDIASPLIFPCDIRITDLLPDTQISIFDIPVVEVGILLSEVPLGVSVIGVGLENTNVASVVMEAERYVLWGYEGSPAAYNAQGKAVLAGAIQHTTELAAAAARADEVALVTRRVSDFQSYTVIAKPDLTITDIEITQAIQCLNSVIAGCEDNSLHVATNRSTAVRVHLKLTPGLALFAQLVDVPVRLWVKAGSGSGAEVFTLDGAGTASSFPDRTEATHSANFFLSIDGDGDIPVRMCAKVDPDNAYSESVETNNGFPDLGSVTKTFEEREPIAIIGAPVDYRPNGNEAALVPNNVVVTSRAIQWLNKIWPVPDKPTGMDYSLAGSFVWTNANGNLNDGTGNGQHALIQNLNAAWVIATLVSAFVGGDVPISDFYYGWTGVTRYSGGHADMPIYPHAGGLGVVGIGDDSTANTWPDRGTAIFGHELTHNMDVMHTDTADGCGSTDDGADFPYAGSSIQEVGFDPITGRVYDPSNTHDVMSYCPAGGSTEGWIAPFTWEKIWDDFAVSPASAAIRANDGLVTPLTSHTGPYLVIDGSVDQGGTGAIGGGYIVDGVDLGLPIETGDYAIEQLNTLNEVLSSQPFAVNFQAFSIPDAPTFDTALFLLTVPFEVEATKVRLMQGTTVLDTMIVPGTAPQVGFTSPLGGETLDGTVSVQWDDLDTGFSGRRYGLFFQRESGGALLPLALDLTQPQFDLDTTRLPGTVAGRLVLLTTDNLRTTQTESATFVVPNKDPLAEIIEPADGAAFDARDAIVLVGRGLDADDGTPPGENMTWTSDIDGPLGGGTVLALGPSAGGEGLTPGLHAITLKVVDTDGDSDTQTINISVLQPPTVTLAGTPNDGTAPLSVTLTATANDPDGTVDSFEWDFDGDGVVDDTTSTNSIDHTFNDGGEIVPSVLAVDNDGLSAYALFAVDITAAPPTPTPTQIPGLTGWGGVLLAIILLAVILVRNARRRRTAMG